MQWSFQLYSARNFLPWHGVLRTLAQLGYSEVEGFGGAYADARTFRAELDRTGLAMPTGHFSIELLEQQFDIAARVADVLGIRLMACPYLDAPFRPADAAGWQAFGERLGRIGQSAKKAGFDFAWHNHDFEFVPLSDGSMPQTHILAAAPEIGWEIDVAWVIRAGADPLQWIAEHGARIVAVHVKDIAPAGEAVSEDGWADVGHGTVDWRGLVAELKASTPAQHFIVEHDNPSDFRRFASRSIETLKTL